MVADVHSPAAGDGEVSKRFLPLTELQDCLHAITCRDKRPFVTWPSEVSAAKTWLTEEAAGVGPLQSSQHKIKIMWWKMHESFGSYSLYNYKVPLLTSQCTAGLSFALFCRENCTLNGTCTLGRGEV